MEIGAERGLLTVLALALLPACSGEAGHPPGTPGAVRPCEGRWDVVVRGDYVDPLPVAWATTWTSRWAIDALGKTAGVVTPDARGWPTYEVAGVQAAPGGGSSDGTFPTPPDLRSRCGGATVAIHVDYAIRGGAFTGKASYRCPEVLGPYDLTGTLTCGGP